jgi:glyoxylase-like metal-dependent hydrolase (beta-lactamase superfamily II)
VTHRDAAKTLQEQSAVFRGQLPESGAIWEKYPETTGLQWVVPDITFSERMQFHWADEAVLIEHHPGPRPGSSWVIIPSEKVVFIGDTASVTGPPFLGKAHLPTWIDTLDILLRAKYKEYQIISGRGGPVNLDKIRELKKSFRKIHRRIEKLANRRVPVDDVSDLAGKFMDEFSFLKRDREFFLQRLRHGLSQYYVRNYFPQTDDNGKKTF